MTLSRTWRALSVVALVATGCSNNSSSSSSDSSSSGTDATDAVDITIPVTTGESSVNAVPVVATRTDLVDGAYPLADFIGTDIWVDPERGDDGNDGATRDTAMRTIDAAWQRVPAGTQLQTGYRLRLVAGTYPQATSVNYWENRLGTAMAPIIIEAADGPHTATFEGDINMFGVSHFALVGVDIVRDGDAFHCESCDHILLRDVALSGGTGAHETVKINQSQHIYMESSDIHGADDNAIDFVAVQYGHIIGSRIHGAQDWCLYAKGGSAYLTIEGNEVFDCGTGGITAGQGTGFEFMVAPWLNYEAYAIEIIDNVVHDTEGAGLGVAGGFNVLFARNTLYRVGTRSHLVEFVHGRRGCDGTVELSAKNHEAGGWGSIASEEPIIPNRHIFFVNNVVLNPQGVQSEWQHFQVDGPFDTPESSGVPSPSLADDDLHIAGNVIWNGPADLTLGLGDGCPNTHATCNEALVLGNNAINTFEPRLVDPDGGDYSLTDETARMLPPAVDIPAFVWDETPIPVPFF